MLDKNDIISRLVMARSGQFSAEQIAEILSDAFDEIVSLRKTLKAIKPVDLSERQRKARAAFDDATSLYDQAKERKRAAFEEYDDAKKAYRFFVEREVEERGKREQTEP